MRYVVKKKEEFYVMYILNQEMTVVLYLDIRC